MGSGTNHVRGRASPVASAAPCHLNPRDPFYTAFSFASSVYPSPCGLWSPGLAHWDHLSSYPLELRRGTSASSEAPLEPGHLVRVSREKPRPNDRIVLKLHGRNFIPPSGISFSAALKDDDDTLRGRRGRATAWREYRRIFEEPSGNRSRLHRLSISSCVHPVEPFTLAKR